MLINLSYNNDLVNKIVSPTAWAKRQEMTKNAEGLLTNFSNS